MTYDANGNLASTTDARGKTISYTYDALNRKTGEYDGPSSASPQLASWVYDNSNNVSGVTDPVGQLTTETSYSGGNAYTLQQTGFNVFGESLGQTLTLPSAEGEPGRQLYPHPPVLLCHRAAAARHLPRLPRRRGAARRDRHPRVQLRVRPA